MNIKEFQILVQDLFLKINSLESRIVLLEDENQKLKEENKALKLENKELKSRLNSNSSNSSKPPSSDGYKNKPTQKPAFPKNKGKKKGGQKGHKGKT